MIFHSYVKLPEGMYIWRNISPFINKIIRAPGTSSLAECSRPLQSFFSNGLSLHWSCHLNFAVWSTNKNGIVLCILRSDMYSEERVTLLLQKNSHIYNIYNIYIYNIYNIYIYNKYIFSYRLRYSHVFPHFPGRGKALSQLEYPSQA